MVVAGIDGYAVAAVDGRDERRSTGAAEGVEDDTGCRGCVGGGAGAGLDELGRTGEQKLAGIATEDGAGLGRQTLDGGIVPCDAPVGGGRARGCR